MVSGAWICVLAELCIHAEFGVSSLAVHITHAASGDVVRAIEELSE